MEVLNKYHIKEASSNHVSIMRGTAFGNPYTMELCRNDRELVVNLFRYHFMNLLANEAKSIKLFEALPDSSGLVCVCKPKDCHGDVYLEYYNLFKELGHREARKAFLAKYHYQFLPQLDGINHVNIYSKSKTELGRLASNFAFTPFEHPVLGKFHSVEGFWFYVGTGFRHEKLRTMYGAQAKAEGSSHPKVHLDNFVELVEEAIRCKVEATPRLKELLTHNHLPFKHYYVYGPDDNCKCIREGQGFLEDIFTRISNELNPGIKVIIAGSRTIKDVKWMNHLVASSGLKIGEIVEGGAKGLDTYGYLYGLMNKIPSKPFHVTKEQWEKTRAAGMIRNKAMGDYADALIVGIENNSKGSVQMAEYMSSLGKLVYRLDYPNLTPYRIFDYGQTRKDSTDSHR